MSGNLKLALVGISFVLILGIAGTFVHADPITTTGTITGTVSGVNGPTSGVSIKLFAFSGRHVKGSSPSKTGKHAKRSPVAEGTTGPNGTFTLSNVPEGNYVVIAILKGVGHGHAVADLTGNSVSVFITLKAGHKK